MPALRPSLRATTLGTPAHGDTWLSDELWVEVTPGASAEALARRHGVSLRRSPGPSGLAIVSVPGGRALDALRGELAGDPSVLSVSRVGAMSGAGRGGNGSATLSLSDLQWHLGAASVTSGSVELSDIVVAVLDTGVAFEDHSDATGDWHQAASLSGVRFVAPYDFVNGDAYPDDDHLHGTHVTSLIASEGQAPGVAPGVSVMPVKVLDQDNSGSEADLVDAIYWAVDGGADVINLSLTFAAGYVPSPALQRALETAYDAGVIMVGAAGNAGEGAARYPAASPLVLSVGASTMKNKSGKLEDAPYSNLGLAIDVLAPGGDLDVDANKDDYPDGLLAEGPPGADGAARYYLYAGSSQAVALVSGAVVQLLAAGVESHEEIAHALQSGASRQAFNISIEDGEGAGTLDLDGALAWAAEGSCASEHALYAMVLPYLSEASDGAAVPTAWVSVVLEDGAPSERVLTAMVTARGPDGQQTLLCALDASGSCEVSLSRDGSVDAESLKAWSFTVDGVWDEADASVTRPRRGVFVTDSLVVLTEAMAQQGLLEGSALGVAWRDTTDDVLGELMASYAVVDLGLGAATAPTALLLTPALMEALASVEEVDVDLDGAGLVTEPLGFTKLSKFSFYGSGLVTEPLGFRLYTIDGSGLVTEPLGFHALDLFSIGGAGLVTEPLGFSSDLLQLDLGRMTTVNLDGLALSGFVAAGAWQVNEGEQLATWMEGTGAVGFELSASADEAAGVASGAVEVE